MTSPRIWLGNQALKTSGGRAEGQYVDIEGERFYCISHFDQMDDFFISLVSYANHWLFISTSGGLTAGRANSGNALFPYYTEDKIRDGARHTGHRAVLLITRGSNTFYWEPFARHFDGAYELERNLYKDVRSTTISELDIAMPGKPPMNSDLLKNHGLVTVAPRGSTSGY